MRHPHVFHLLCALMTLCRALRHEQKKLVDDIEKVALTLGFKGQRFAFGSDGYLRYKFTKNGACNDIYPVMILRPVDTTDVSIAVKIARKVNVPLSVRSGGHSYICANIKDGAIHIDLRLLNKVKLLPQKDFKYVLLGPGSSWDRILKILPPEKYTYLHGQCTDVGVGGYLLGGGANLIGTSAKFGHGAQNVDEYTLVNHVGDVLKVDKDYVNTYDTYGRWLNTTKLYYYNDLFYALKGAGSSYAIATEFKYRVYKEPETKPVFIAFYLRGPKDVEKIMRICEKRRLQIALFRFQHFRPIQISLNNLENVLLAKGPGVIRALSRSTIDPVGAMVVDLKSKTLFTSLKLVRNTFKRYGFQMVFTDRFDLDLRVAEIAGFDRFDPNLSNYESYYLTSKQLRRRGPQGLFSVNAQFIRSPKIFEDIVFNDETFGLGQPSKNIADFMGCDFCYWVLYPSPFWQNTKETRFTPNHPGVAGSSYAYDFTCNYDHTNQEKVAQCRKAVDYVRKKMNTATERLGEKVNQYYNTPSCSTIHNEPSFTERYWRGNYQRLLQIKHVWDPENIFHHCHSVGSSEENCCRT